MGFEQPDGAEPRAAGVAASPRRPSRLALVALRSAAAICGLVAVVCALFFVGLAIAKLWPHGPVKSSGHVALRDMIYASRYDRVRTDLR